MAIAAIVALAATAAVAAIAVCDCRSWRGRAAIATVPTLAAKAALMSMTIVHLALWMGAIMASSEYSCRISCRSSREQTENLFADHALVVAAVAESATLSSSPWTASALRYAAAELGANSDPVFATIGSYVDALFYAAAELRADIDIVLAAVSKGGHALRCAAAERRADCGSSSRPCATTSNRSSTRPLSSGPTTTSSSQP